VVGDTRSFTGLPEYAVSKLANVLFTSELARRHDVAQLRACSLHPGRVSTDIFRRMPRPLLALTKIVRPMITPEQGAATTLHCATASDIPHGAYLSDCRVTEPSRLAQDPELARELWDRSAEWVKLPSV
jgi:retinol dehydrogenase-12